MSLSSSGGSEFILMDPCCPPLALGPLSLSNLCFSLVSGLPYSWPPCWAVNWQTQEDSAHSCPTTCAPSYVFLSPLFSLSFLGGCLSSGEDPLAGDQNDHDMDSIAGVLKLYFRGLEHPLFPKDIFHDLMACVSKYILASDWLLSKNTLSQQTRNFHGVFLSPISFSIMCFFFSFSFSSVKFLLLVFSPLAPGGEGGRMTFQWEARTTRQLSDLP